MTLRLAQGQALKTFEFPAIVISFIGIFQVICAEETTHTHLRSLNNVGKYASMPYSLWVQRRPLARFQIVVSSLPLRVPHQESFQRTLCGHM